ncbi:MAG: site-specific integrase [Bacteroidetes bacterium]|nr:site-specific integrase [Bacteroidota bacterium]
MNTNIVITLDTRRKKKDGLYPIVMRLGHNRTTTAIPLGYHIHEKDWDEKNRLVKNSYKGVSSVTRLNNAIQKKKSDAMDIILKLDESGVLASLSVTALKDKVYKADSKNSIFQFADDLIEELKKAHRIGTARGYKDVMGVLKKYCNDKDLSFQNLNYDFLTKFETHHYSKGNSANGLAVYMRTIRAIYNKAVKAGLVEKELYPFNDYKIKTTPTEKRALDWEFIKKIIEQDIKPGQGCFNARNYFVASYMMYGMNYTDMAFLKKSDISDGRIKYRRKKTSKLYDIKITANLETILSFYINRNPESEYVFPILKRDTPLLQYRDIEWARKRYNKKLKDLAAMCGIEGNLTSYVSRHSFATQAMLQQVPLNAISSMLGHSSLKTTQVYLKSLPNNVLDDYNELILAGK